MFAYSPITYDVVMNDAMKQKWLKQKAGLWSKTESTVLKAGKFAWIVPLIYGSLVVVEGIFWIIASPAFNQLLFGLYNPLVRAIWLTIVGVILILTALLYIKPRFSDKCAAKEWEFIVNDIVALRVLRIPKWLIFGLIIIILPLYF